jgi:DNA-binding transcriptional MerR regulator
LNIRELSKQLGETERNIRFLIAEGVVPAPRGTRAMPEYGPAHADAIRRYQRLKVLGFKLAQIKVMSPDADVETIELAPGLSLRIDRAVAPDLDAESLARRIRAAIPDHTEGSTS